MAENKAENKKIELWKGREVALSLKLLQDADYLEDLRDAQAKNDVITMATMMVALVAGERGERTKTMYDEIRKHIIKEKGFFDIEELGKIVERISDALPKGGGRAQRRGWRISR